MSTHVSAGRARKTARVEAQAKINLYLRIVSREASGYHQLETLFQRIALADSVSVTTGGPSSSLDCRGAETGPVEKNLAWRAARAFFDATGEGTHFQIEIEKRIPVGGGLGGGSADAAAVLRALNAMAEQPLDDKALSAIAFTLGADVPYLLSPHATALGAGRGEKLFALEPLAPRNVALAIPPFGISSADAFGWFAETKAVRVSGTRATFPVRKQLEWRTVAALADNDLERVVTEHHPEIGKLRESLRARGAAIAMMSGSGSTVFGVFDAAAPSAIEGSRVVVTSTVDRVATCEFAPHQSPL
jgi:4-diphosphocytidyl-2-C-methyl-D-erythritol kinase